MSAIYVNQLINQQRNSFVQNASRLSTPMTQATFPVSQIQPNQQVIRGRSQQYYSETDKKFASKSHVLVDQNRMCVNNFNNSNLIIDKQNSFYSTQKQQRSNSSQKLQLYQQPQLIRNQSLNQHLFQQQQQQQQQNFARSNIVFKTNSSDQKQTQFFQSSQNFYTHHQQFMQNPPQLILQLPESFKNNAQKLNEAIQRSEKIKQEMIENNNNYTTQKSQKENQQLQIDQNSMKTQQKKNLQTENQKENIIIQQQQPFQDKINNNNNAIVLKGQVIKKINPCDNQYSPIKNIGTLVQKNLIVQKQNKNNVLGQNNSNIQQNQQQIYQYNQQQQKIQAQYNSQKEKQLKDTQKSTIKYQQKVLENNLNYEGMTENGFPHGYGILKDQNQNEIYKGDWVKGEQNGCGILYNLNKNPENGKKVDFQDVSQIIELNQWSRYEGDFRNNKIEGFGTMNLVGGEKIIGIFSNGIINGQGSFYNKDQEIVSCIWKQGKLIQMF